jgi:glycosyltransferase involved in cell wall biosynthesis
MRQVSIWAKKNNAVSIGISDSWKGDKTRYFPLEILKGIWCRTFYDGMFLSGSRTKAYYSGIGFPESRMWFGHNVVDNDYYSVKSSAIKKSTEKYRNKYQLPVNYFLCVARFSPEKNLRRLIMSYAMYKKAQGTWDLVLIGSGPLENELKQLVTILGLESNVYFMGWRQIDEMPIFYGLASCLILPSLSEPWGNVVNEAMASGLPVLLSEKCGCLPELCIRGINGFQFDPLNLSDMTDCMLRISSGIHDIHKMSEKSKEIITGFSPENYALSLSDAIDTLSNLKM